MSKQNRIEFRTRPGFVKELSEISVAVVDNYQGEENDLILLSLVRSNATSGTIGFLRYTCHSFWMDV